MERKDTLDSDMSSADIECVVPVAEEISIDDLEAYLKKEKNEIVERFSTRIRYDCNINDFLYFQTLGAGSFGRVILAKKKDSGKYYAIKVLVKRQLVKTKQVEHTLNEKKVLECIRFPFVIHMEYFFQDNSCLFFTMPLILGGELFSYLRKSGKLHEVNCKFYGAQILLALEYLHYLDLAYRDLKPENILININGYLKLTDFGFCKVVHGRTYTLCGTPEYLAPEIILSKGYGKTVDWWSYGVLLFEMCAGYPPFYAKDHLKLYEKIVTAKYKIPSHFSADLADILNNMLQVDLSKRFGNLTNGVHDIKDHIWFQSIKWHQLLNQQVKAPYVPEVKHVSDISHFELSNEELAFSTSTQDRYAKEFIDF